jgi:hypothetical protein
MQITCTWSLSPPTYWFDISCLEEAAGGSNHFQKTWGRLPPAAPRIPAKHTLLVIGSVADPWNFGTDLPLANGSGSRFGSGCGSGPCYFRQWPSRRQQKIIVCLLFMLFLLITFWRYIYINFSKIKSHKKSQNSRNQCFSYYFCLIIEGSGFLTNGSGSGSPKNVWILRIRIRNTGYRYKTCDYDQSLILPS